jgi:cullin-associated NEDD8-dissociated protein 1
MHIKDVIQKRAAQCLGALAVVSTDALLHDLIHALLTRINELDQTGKAKVTSHEARTLIQTIGTVSRCVGFRLGKFLPQIVPLFIRFCAEPDGDDEESHSHVANDLRESCFLGFESFVSRCPKEVVSFIPEILRVSLSFLKYDPNYSYEDFEDQMDMDDDEGIGLFL